MAEGKHGKLRLGYKYMSAAGRAGRCLTTGSTGQSAWHGLEWDGRGDLGRPVAPGCYFLRLGCGTQYYQTKLVKSR